MVAGQRKRGSQASLAAAALLAAALVAAATLPAAHAAAINSTAPGFAPDDYLNSQGIPLLMPISGAFNNHSWYYELPMNSTAGVLVMLHRCGRNAEDFWPPSEICPQCIGLPEAVSMTKQALARGYAVLAINSFNRSVGSQTRCWSWHTDSVPVKDIVEGFRKELGLLDVPLFLTGCSSGGSLALRLPGIMQIDGVIPVAIGLDLGAFPAVDMGPAYPPIAFIHFTKDNNTDGKIVGMKAVMEQFGIPMAEKKLDAMPITPDFFSRRDPMISLAVSEQLHAALVSLNAIGSAHYMTAAWEDGSMVLPWEQLLEEQLAGMLKSTEAQQLELKQNSTLAQAQQALYAAGEDMLTIQEVSADVNADADAEADGEDINPNFSDSNSTASSSGGQDPYLSDILLVQHIREEMGVAWAEHTNIGDYTTAALIWLERCGTVDFAGLLEEYAVEVPAELSPARTLTSDHVTGKWLACKANMTAYSSSTVLEPGQLSMRSSSSSAPRSALAAAAAAGAAVTALMSL